MASGGLELWADSLGLLWIGGLGMWEVLLILLVLLLVFGAKRLPELGGSLGKGIREFKKSVREIESELSQSVDEPNRELRSGGTTGAAGGEKTTEEPAKVEAEERSTPS